VNKWLVGAVACVIGFICEMANAGTPLGLSQPVNGGDPIALSQACISLAAGSHVCTTKELTEISQEPTLPPGPWTAVAVASVVAGVSTGSDGNYVDALGLSGGSGNCVLVTRAAVGNVQVQVANCGVHPALCCGTLPDGLFANGFEGT
jgi:hypothetical protein